MLIKGKLFWLGLSALGLAVTSTAKTVAPNAGDGKDDDTAKKGYVSGVDRDKGNFMRQSPGAIADRQPTDWGLGPNAADKLPTYPQVDCGQRTPFDIWRYAGRHGSSFGTTSLPMSWDEWVKMNMDNKAAFMKDIDAYMASRYDWTMKAIPGAFMSGGKPVMAGPIARLPEGVESWEALAAMSPAEIRARDLFPYKPLSHPSSTIAHIVFPDNWLATHPEHRRMDMDHDFPDEYLPEFPPPLFLSNHKELGDASQGHEITMANYYSMFDGLLSADQMDGLKELLRPTATTWINHTTHRIVEEPSAGVACMSCHVNGHTNGAFELAPDARPNEARLRVDTPSMRGNYNNLQLSAKRSIRSLDHFSEVEEYFDGDTDSLGGPIGLADRQRRLTNRMGDFNAMVDNPPAPKLSPLMKLYPDKATEQELRGEALFHGKAQCSQCHYGPQFNDTFMHDLEVERFYVGRPEGPIKTFGLRGIKDSPPYLHDGRLPTLGDTVEFFDIVLQLGLNKQEKDDLVAYLLCL